MAGPDQHSMVARNWLCAIAYGATSADADRLSRDTGQSMRDLFDAVDALESKDPRHGQASVTVALVADEVDRRFRKLRSLIERLTIDEQRAVIGHHVGLLPIDSLPTELELSRADLESGTTRLLTGSSSTSIEALMAPVFEVTAPNSTPERRNPGRLVLSGFATVCLVAALLTIGRAAKPPLDSQVVAPENTTAPTTQAPTTEAPEPEEESPASTSEPPTLFVEPDREIEVLVTERDTLVRVEPWTGRLIWESRPFTDLELVSVDPNTVTAMSRGNRLVISLTDGTLLPP